MNLINVFFPFVFEAFCIQKSFKGKKNEQHQNDEISEDRMTTNF